VRLAPLFFLSLLSSASLSFAQGPPAIGQWVTGPLGNRHDLVSDAVTSAQLAMSGGGQALTNQATTFLACKGGLSTGPVLELRFLVPPIRGFNAAAINPAATLTIGDKKSAISLDVFPVQASTMFVITPNPVEAKHIASLTLTQRESLYLHFQVAGREAFFLTFLGDPSGPVANVLTACKVSIPAQPPFPSNATAEMRKYTFQGIYVGMAPQEAMAAEKAIASTPIKPSPAGGVEFETTQFHFSVTTSDDGFVDLYQVCGRAAVKGNLRNGPLYNAAVKEFSAGTQSDPNTIHWGPSGGVYARYEWDPSEEPGGCLVVSKNAR